MIHPDVAQCPKIKSASIKLKLISDSENDGEKSRFDESFTWESIVASLRLNWETCLAEGQGGMDADEVGMTTLQRKGCHSPFG